MGWSQVSAIPKAPCWQAVRLDGVLAISTWCEVRAEQQSCPALCADTHCSPAWCCPDSSLLQTDRQTRGPTLPHSHDGQWCYCSLQPIQKVISCVRLGIPSPTDRKHHCTERRCSCILFALQPRQVSAWGCIAPLPWGWM